MEKIILLGI